MAPALWQKIFYFRRQTMKPNGRACIHWKEQSFPEWTGQGAFDKFLYIMQEWLQLVYDLAVQ